MKACSLDCEIWTNKAIEGGRLNIGHAHDLVKKGICPGCGKYLNHTTKNYNKAYTENCLKGE